jgi:hypothetical protein
VQYSGPSAPRMLKACVVHCGCFVCDMVRRVRCDREHKARIGTHKGAVESLFRPYHVDLVRGDLVLFAAVC